MRLIILAALVIAPVWCAHGASRQTAMSVCSSAADCRLQLSLGTAATLDVGTGANNIVQLDAGGKLPAVDGSALTNLPSAAAAWDWTGEDAENLDDPSVDQLGGSVDVGKWSDASTTNGASVALTSLTAPASFDSKVICGVVPNNASASGFVMDTVAGDFVYAARVSIRRAGSDANDTLTAQAHMVFVDGTNVSSSSWYGAGVRYANSDFDSATWGAHNGINFNSLSNSADQIMPMMMWDVWIERSGTTLNIYAAPPGGAPNLMESYTVSANAGLVGMRGYHETASLTFSICLHAFARISAVPGA